MIKIKISKKTISESSLNRKELENLPRGADIRGMLQQQRVGPPPVGSPEHAKAQRKLSQAPTSEPSSNLKNDLQITMHALEDELVKIFKAHMNDIAGAKQKAAPVDALDKTKPVRKRRRS